MKLKFQVGDRVYDPKYGNGVVRQIDATNYEYPYFVHFRENGTKIWYKAKDAVLAPETDGD